MKNKLIWVIDDDRAILEVVKIVLEEENYSVVCLQSYDEFKQEIKKETIPDLVLLDYWVAGMGVIKNPKVCGLIIKSLKLNNKFSRTSVIILSASPGSEEVSIKLGADEFLAKPFDIDELLKVVKKYSII